MDGEWIAPADSFIIWMAQNTKVLAKNKLCPTRRFFDSLSEHLKPVFLENDPISTTLRTASKYSREYHEAYYQKHALELLELHPNYTPEQIYNDPGMQNVLRAIRDWREPSN